MQDKPLSVAEQMFKTRRCNVKSTNQPEQEAIMPPKCPVQDQHLFNYVQHIPENFFKPKFNQKGDSLELSKSAEIFNLNPQKMKVIDMNDDVKKKLTSIDQMLQDNILK